MKRIFYIFSFTVLGILLQFLAHALLEIWYLNRYTPFDGWYTFHTIAGVVLLVAGAALGFWAGVHFWRVIYVERRYFRRWTR
ncbi:hypothetical protein A3B18_02925 [Candidatus Giovannonibacteria bacterium RIFCSPLOWO2_01_FULL_46_13]|uniref:DUF5671 domain-containing protein n=1 Tax=Candidatus Giovannonibacteria bacterium RIFCSPLOWO2_01_FULL_46_13 TaxID=1798352 RepID=A0A1F5X313_9BACT|nr:MAG: hypothetical protein A3B18_02925 [Candidatus Giovannonibacteria bacterium RIFCSPLOWO2_01_FULL_46_13]